jgi:hypothetical protein
MKKIYKKHKVIVPLLFCMIVSFVILFFTTRNSFFYAFNNWVDENAFFTVGKSWYRGVIPYLGLFEQKGPLLYLLFGLGSLISYRSFVGIFIFEIITVGIFLYLVFKTSKLFISDRDSFLVVPIVGAIICSSFAFAKGGSAEEFCLPLVMYLLYSVCNSLVVKKEMSYKSLFINGLLCGMVFCIKYTMVGFWFGFMVFLLIYLLSSKEYKRALFSTLIFLLGMFIPFGLFSLYFALVGGFKAFINTYIWFNIFGYVDSNVKALSLFNRVGIIVKYFLYNCGYNIFVFLFILLGFLYFGFTEDKHKNLIIKLFMLFILIGAFFFTYWGCKNYRYYYLILEVFSVFGLIAIFKLLDIKKKSISIISIVVVIGLSIFCISRSDNLSYHKRSKSNIVQYQFAKIINKKKEATLLNYGSLDGGFYMTTGIIPNTRYFESQNAVVPGMAKTLNKMISAGKFDFIVVRDNCGYKVNIGEEFSKYKLIKTVREINDETA